MALAQGPVTQNLGAFRVILYHLYNFVIGRMEVEATPRFSSSGCYERPGTVTDRHIHARTEIIVTASSLTRCDTTRSANTEVGDIGKEGQPPREKHRSLHSTISGGYGVVA